MVTILLVTIYFWLLYFRSCNTCPGKIVSNLILLGVSKEHRDILNDSQTAHSIYVHLASIIFMHRRRREMDRFTKALQIHAAREYTCRSRDYH